MNVGWAGKPVVQAWAGGICLPHGEVEEFHDGIRSSNGERTARPGQ